MKTHLSIAGRALLDLVFPAPCLACGRIESGDLGAAGQWRTGPAQRIGLCCRCRLALTPQPRPACALCARPFPGARLPETYVCPDCRSRPPPYERLVAAWVYRPPIDAAILALKFRGLRYLAKALVCGLATRVATEVPKPDAVVPVPLHWRRRLRRGYNQSDELAATLAARLELPLVHALRRRRATRTQMNLPLKDRPANLRGAFSNRRTTQRLRGRRVLLVDDVVTSGATLCEAARCLVRGSAGPVYAAAVARTPDPGDDPCLGETGETGETGATGAPARSAGLGATPPGPTGWL